jgi:hypothetical protein
MKAPFAAMSISSASAAAVRILKITGAPRAFYGKEVKTDAKSGTSRCG